MYTYYEIDITNNDLSITDPRQYTMNESRLAEHLLPVKNFQFLYDMNNRQLVRIGTDNGTKKMLQNALNIIYVFSPRGFTINTKFDQDQRPKEVYVIGNGLNNLVEKIVYGDSPETGHNNNNIMFEASHTSIMTRLA